MKRPTRSADVTFANIGRFVPYAKVLYGRGVFNFPVNPDGFRANLAYNLIAAGVGTDYKVKPYLYVRADWEYQQLVWQFQRIQSYPEYYYLGRSLSLPVETRDSAPSFKTKTPRSTRGFSC